MNIKSVKPDKMRTVTRYIPSIGETILFKIGRNAKNNIEIIEESHPEDIWFHVSKESSCHVIAVMNLEHYNNVCNGVTDPEKPCLRYNFIPDQLTKNQFMHIVKQGAVLCKEYSKCKKKSKKNVEIIYTNVENVTPTNIVGSVIVCKTKNIVI
jgi:predicted ribosome quality control (RQC) complex YloA/Tae2 family protein